MNKSKTLDMVEDYSVERYVIWRAICYAAKQLSGKCSFFVSEKPLPDYQIKDALPFPNISISKLMEVLCLLAVLLRADDIKTNEISNIFKKVGPVHFIENDQDLYLWSQITLKGQRSLFNSRPDLLVTVDSDLPSSANVLRIIECKSGNISATLIRSEFGKAYDLKVESYLIWSLITPSPKIIKGASELGIHIESMGFDSNMRNVFIKKPDTLAYHIAYAIEISGKECRMMQALNSYADEIKTKILLT